MYAGWWRTRRQKHPHAEDEVQCASEYQEEDTWQIAEQGRPQKEVTESERKAIYIASC